MPEGRDERSIGELFSELANETSTLLRQEVQLAKAEMAETARQAGKDVGYMAAGGALAYAGLLVLLFAVVFGLGQFIPLWLSALIVGLVVVAIGYGLVHTGLSALKRVDPTPQQTLETLKEDKEWIKRQMQ